MNLREIAVRAGVTAGEAFLAGLLAVGLTNLTLDGVELAALTAAGAGLSVLYNAARQWLDQTGTVQLGRALRADRDRQLRELRALHAARHELQPGGIIPRPVLRDRG